MKRIHAIALLFGWLALSLTPHHSGHAADASRTPVGQQTGGITGRVQNVATGQYLNNARIAVRGTDQVVFTDESGTYRLSAVPGGAVGLEVFYTGLDALKFTVQVVPGQTTVHDIEMTSMARYGIQDGTVKLDAFVVSTERETDSVAIAVNEQRFAPNIKTVIAADALGDVADSNVGEFLKFLPGVTAEYDGESGSSVASVAVRGFPTSMAVLSSDGMQLANTGNPTGTSRVFQFTQVSMNNISRLEVTKVPTPSTPADALGGSINMVSKSAFERKTAQLRYSVALSANHPFFDLQKTPHNSDKEIYKVRPTVTFDYTLPVTKTFGLVVTGQSQNRFMWHKLAVKTYSVAGTGTGASVSRPYLQQFSLQGSPRINARNSAGLKADWRITPTGVLSVNLEATRFVSDRASATTLMSAGTNATPSVANGVRMTYGDDFSSGATGRGSVTLMGQGASARQQLDTRSVNARYRMDNGDWRVETVFGIARSDGGYQDTLHGRFRTLGIALNVPVRVLMADIDEDRPKTIQLFDNNNREIDFFNLANYRLNTANSTPRVIRDDMLSGKVDVRKSLRMVPFPAALQFGAAQRVQRRDYRRQSMSWTYNGVDGNPNTAETPEPYGMTKYVNQKESFGFRNMPWVSVHKVWEAFQANPTLWSKTPAQAVTEETFRITNSERLQEGVSALYQEAELGLLRNRLKVVAGVRYERTATEGEGALYDPGAVWVRNANGTFARNAAGARIRKPEAGAAGSMEEVRLTRRERGFTAKRTYDGYYPSVHLTYHVTENVLARAAYAKSYGRPDFTNIVPNSTVDEADLDGEGANPELVRGRITIRNTGLRPWSADNYDLSLEYYTDQGGLISAGVFMKEIKDFFGDAVRIGTTENLQELGLSPAYAGWLLSTQFNLPDLARVRGVEFNVRHSLRPLGTWGRMFQVFANATKLDLSGSQQANFDSFIPESANWGITFSRKSATVMARWNYRGLQKGTEIPSINGFEYSEPRTTLDVNMDYQLRNNLSWFLNAQNVFNVNTVLLRYGPETPAYARRNSITRYGMQLTMGLKGTF